MSQNKLQGNSLEALKLFNNAIVTSRLYPSDAPQVSTAVERGYEGIKLYLRQHGTLLFSQKNDIFSLDEKPLEQKVLDSFPNLVVFRQLRLLELPTLIIKSEMDRFAFTQLLTVFTASVEKIKNSGGGRAFITGLGLAGYFPEGDGNKKETLAIEGRLKESQPRRIVAVRAELVASLLGKDKRSAVQADLADKMAATDTAIDILSAGIASILQGIQKKRMIVVSQDFALMLKSAEELIVNENLQEVAMGLGKRVVQTFSKPALCVLFSQEFPGAFGGMVYAGLITFLPAELLGGIISLIREQVAKAKLSTDTNPRHIEFLSKVMLRLMNTEKGKNYLNTEKTKAIIEKGEKKRKKQRLEAGIQGLLQGNTTLLKNIELIAHLPHAVSIMLKNNQSQEVSVILEAVTAHLEVGEESTARELLYSATAVGDILASNGYLHLLDIILEPLVEKVQNDATGDDLIEKIVTLLQRVMQLSWREGENERGDSILTLFHKIRSGETPKTAVVAEIVGRIQDKGIGRADLPKLLKRCLAEPKNTTLSYRLILQGPVAVRFLVDSLINTDNSSDRIKIIDLLTYGEKYLPPVIRERLPGHMPWFGKRNLIKLLGETGKEEDAESVLPYLSHDDFRVQREAFLCIYKIGGKSRKRLLLAALDESPELLKIQIIAALAGFCDQEVATRLTEFLEGHEHFSEKNRNEILLKILSTLGRCPCTEAQKGVQRFLRTRGQKLTKRIPQQIWHEAELALKFLDGELHETRKKHVQTSQLRKNALKQAASIGQGATVQKVITGLPQEQTIRTLLLKGDKDTAGEQLLQLIERTARLRNFIQADKLRDWLVEIDPTAFTQIIRAAEIIDREKAAAIDKSHLEIWSNLYDILSTEEFSAVYHSLTHRKYVNGEVIVNRGDVLGSLYFLNSGTVKLYFEEEGSELLVKTMDRGQIFGADAFFEASAWTISVASIGNSEVSVLKLDKLKKCDDDFPGLEGKLHDFCMQFETIDEFLKRSSKDRRLHKRHKVGGRTATTLLDSNGRSTGVNSIGDLVDISAGGVSYQLKISRKENARLLLGRKVEMQLPGGTNPGDIILLTGDILAVKCSHAVANDYSVHVQFNSLIDDKRLQEVIAAVERESTKI